MINNNQVNKSSILADNAGDKMLSLEYGYAEIDHTYSRIHFIVSE